MTDASFRNSILSLRLADSLTVFTATRVSGSPLMMSLARPSYTIPKEPCPSSRITKILSRGTSHSSGTYTAQNKIIIHKSSRCCSLQSGGLTVGHEEVGGLSEGPVPCQRGGADPHAVVPRLNQRQLRPAGLQVANNEKELMSLLLHPSLPACLCRYGNRAGSWGQAVHRGIAMRNQISHLQGVEMFDTDLRFSDLPVENLVQDDEAVWGAGRFPFDHHVGGLGVHDLMGHLARDLVCFHCRNHTWRQALKTLFETLDPSSSSSSGLAVVESNCRPGAVVRKKLGSVALATPLSVCGGKIWRNTETQRVQMAVCMTAPLTGMNDNWHSKYSQGKRRERLLDPDVFNINPPPRCVPAVEHFVVQVVLEGLAVLDLLLLLLQLVVGLGQAQHRPPELGSSVWFHFCSSSLSRWVGVRDGSFIPVQT
ncbi:hypothetical protein F7725_027341 [Dissostichus mawsoni]|uniref:Uncharacterized protein n=1 Tax=Dissostichus mawsoni TaxID=36200 RepID=A0A7J5XD60_DISMA|nr:hypothetical protein F7725_027341 [Dissostichus mawsoni]